ncbi:MAG: PAS domain S-box protein [Candidatus Kapaibacterium sp.]
MASIATKILIVEDENLVAKNLQLLLVRMQYQVVGISAYGENLSAMVEEHAPDIILIDISLRGTIDGIEAARRLHEIHDIPVVFITANSDMATLQRSKIARPYGYILKPFVDRDIQSAIEMALSRQQADRELHESRAWLTTTLQSIGDAVIATDDNGLVKFMNPIAEELTGWQHRQAVGQPLPAVFRIINESSRAIVENPVDIVLREKRIVSLANHTILLSKDGREYVIDDAAAPIRDHNGTITGVVLTFRDSTQKYKAEAEIAANERRFRALIENNQDMIHMVDAAGRVLYTSPSAERITGYTAEELRSQPLLELLHPDDVADAQRIVAAVMSHPFIPIQVQQRIRRKDGCWLWVDGTVTNLLDDPDIRAVVSNIRDITARKHAVEEGHRGSHRLRTVLDSLQEGILILNHELKIVDVNTLATTILGLSYAELHGRSLLDLRWSLIHEDRSPFTDDNYPPSVSLQNGTSLSGIVVGVRKADGGTLLWLSVNSTPLYFDGASRPNGVVVSFVDITEQKRVGEIFERNTQLLEESQSIANLGGWEIDLRTGNLFWTAETYRIHDTSPEELALTMDTALSFLTPESKKQLVAALDLAAKHGIGYDLHLELYTAQGRKVDVRMTCDVTRTDDGKPTKLTGIFQDITDRKKIEKEVFDSKLFLLKAQEAGGIGVYRHDLRTSVWECTHETDIIFGIDEHYPHTIDGWLSLMHPDFQQKTDDYFWDIIHQQKPFNFEYKILRPCDGAERWIHGLGEMEFDTDGTPLYLVGTVQDITDRKQKETELLNTNTRLRLATSAAKIGIWERDMRTNTSIWDDTMYDMYRISDKDSFRFEDWYAMVADEDKAKITDSTTAALTSHDVVGVEFKVNLPDGSTRIIDSSVIAAKDSSGSATTVIGTNIDITEQRQAEVQLRQSEERYRDLLYNLETGIVVHAPDTSVVMSNPKAAELLGLSDDQMRGKLAIDPAWHFVDEGGVPLPLEKYPVNQIAANKQPMKGRIFGIRQPGNDSVIWVMVNGFATLDSQGDITEIVVSFFDVTERVIATEKLRQNEKNLHAIIDAITIPTVVTDTETGQVVYANQQTADLFGVPLDQALGQKSMDYYPNPDDRARLMTILATEGIVSNSLVQMRRSSGELVWVLLSARPIMFQGKQALVATMYDITNQKTTETKLQEQADLLDIVPDAIIVRNLEDTIISWSKGAEQMYGFTAREAVGTFAPELIGTGDIDDFYAARKVLFADGNWTGEFLQKTKAGKIILVQSRWKLVRNTANEPISVLVTNTDITEKKSLEKQLFRAQRLESIGTLASGIAHDLNNILTPVVLGMELIKLTTADEPTRKRIDTIISTVQRGSGLIGQVLSFARGSQDEREAINIHYIIDEVVKIARETFPREIDVALNLPSDELIANGNATQIHQVLMNLCINARDAMSAKGGTLTIEADYSTATESLLSRVLDAKPGEYVRIMVRDTGVGISPELQDKIFEPFYTTKEVGKGTGIGLTTVFAIVRNHAGFIELQSQVGVGTTFTIYLPAEHRTDEESTFSYNVSQLPALGATILLADDEDLIRNIAEDILQAYGYKVITAQNGVEALRLYTEHQSAIAAVITDIMMPVMGGIELMGCLRAINPEIRIIAASGVMHSDSAKNIYAAGAQSILLKPFTVDKLLDSIREVLE